jgi:WD40 repeat protein
MKIIPKLVCLVLIALSPLPAAAAGYRLQFVKQIGPGWDAQGWMSFVAFSPDGRRIASDAPASAQDTSSGLTIWSFPGGRLLKHSPGRFWTISRDWKYYANESGIHALKDGAPLPPKAAQTYPVTAFGRGHMAVSLPAQDGPGPAMRVFDRVTGKTIVAFGQHRVSSIAISPDGRILAAGYWDCVMLWDMRTGKRLGVLRGIGRYVGSLSFSPNGRLLAAGTDWNELQIWDLRRRVRLRVFKFDGGDVSEAAFSPDGRLVAAGVYGSGTVWLADLRSGKLLDHKKVSDLGCGSAAFSPDGRYLITPSTGGLITWPYDRGGTIRVFRVVYRK